MLDRDSRDACRRARASESSPTTTTCSWSAQRGNEVADTLLGTAALVARRRRGARARGAVTRTRASARRDSGGSGNVCRARRSGLRRIRRERRAPRHRPAAVGFRPAPRRATWSHRAGRSSRWRQRAPRARASPVRPSATGAAMTTYSHCSVRRRSTVRARATVSSMHGDAVVEHAEPTTGLLFVHHGQAGAGNRSFELFVVAGVRHAAAPGEHDAGTGLGDRLGRSGARSPRAPGRRRRTAARRWACRGRAGGPAAARPRRPLSPAPVTTPRGSAPLRWGSTPSTRAPARRDSLESPVWNRPTSSSRPYTTPTAIRGSRVRPRMAQLVGFGKSGSTGRIASS